ncbi:15120_t:CDS:2 [Cetraspora pellucida]|uniref:15120_t:CDS:1 n=1 Tax=Cetraspora pellucida TaxID=1433469 RepID=A0A9N9GRG5_9GLOM|nr:15120_t:CDS:2 [Cetraspora pellucida]
MEPSVHKLKEIQENAKVQVTHKVTQMWIQALEKFCSDVGYKRKIEEVNSKTVLEDQLSKFVYVMTRQNSKEYHTMSVRSCMVAIWRYLNEYSVMEKPVDILNPKVYFDLNQVINEKLKTLTAKGLGEHVRADGLTLNEVEQILDYSTINNRNKFLSKANILNSVEFCGQWYYAHTLDKQKLKEYFKIICETTAPNDYNDNATSIDYNNNTTPIDYNNNANPDNYDEHSAPDNNEAPKGQRKASLVNAFDDLEVFSDGSSNVLTECNQNVHDTDDEKEKDKSAKKNNQKEKVRAVIGSYLM